MNSPSEAFALASASFNSGSSGEVGSGGNSGRGDLQCMTSHTATAIASAKRIAVSMRIRCLFALDPADDLAGLVDYEYRVPARVEPQRGVDRDDACGD